MTESRRPIPEGFWLRFFGAVVLVLVSTYPAAAQTRSGLREPVRFSAKDSLVVVPGDSIRSGDLGLLFGAASVQYAEAALEAHRIEIRFDIDELRASGLPTDSGLVGSPAFRQGEETFTGTELAFNLRSERGRVVGARTEIEEGFLRADVVKADTDSILYVRNGVYTTCPCVEDPSYSLRSSRMKVVGGKWIYTGPIQLYLFNIPTPLWLPFGFLPATEGRRSGPLPPSYGEDEFGFYLRDIGWYFALSEYVDLQLQAGLWTRGSIELEALSRYRKRYGYSGQLQLAVGRFRNGERGDPDFTIRRTGSLRWTHAQPIGLSANFDANVNLSSSGYLRGVSQDYDDRVRQSIQSSVRYTKRWSSRSLTISANQRQIVETGSVNLTIPNVSFSQSSFKPFQRDRGPGEREAIYEKLTVSYSFSSDNRFDFVPLADDALLAAGDTAAVGYDWIDALLSQDAFRRATGNEDRFAFKASHRIPISAPFQVSRLPVLGPVSMSVSPSFSYTEDWTLRSERQSLVETESGTTVEKESVPGFFALRQFTASVSASTAFYGLFPVEVGPYRGVRHTVRPSIGFGWRPDFYEERWGYTRRYVDANGKEVVYPVVAGVGRGEQQALTFSLNNTFETKRAVVDSTAANRAPETVKLLDLAFSSSYNMAADSLGFGAINLTGRTRLFGQVDVDFRSSFSPYELGSSGTTVDRYAFGLDAPFGRLTSASLTIRTSLRSRAASGTSRPLQTARAGFGAGTTDAFGGQNGSAFGNAVASSLDQAFGSPATDFSIPWSLSLDLTYGVTKPQADAVRRAVLNATFDFSLTPNWKVTGRTGYDIQRGEMALTNLAFARDFDCWQMALTWIPFGTYQSWGFDLHVKSGQLRDLLRIRQPRSDVRDRFGSL